VATKGQLTGMQGVYLVAAELSRHGFIASPTSRSARGADILVTDEDCRSAHSIQVKTNASSSNYWLLNQHAKAMDSDSHVYVFVNLKAPGTPHEFYVVPSKIVSDKMWVKEHKAGTWYGFSRDDAKAFQDAWGSLGKC